MKIHQKLLTVAGWVLASSLSLGGCVTHDETDQPLVLCALAKAPNLSVSFSPQLGSGTYTLVLETPDGTSECLGTFGASSSESCSGDVDVMSFWEGGFGVYGTPTEVKVMLEHQESAQRF